MLKKKILMLSDDIRLHSGVGTMARSIIEGTAEKYDWVNIGGAVKHPEEGKPVDISKLISDSTGKNANVKVYPVSGYGNPQLLRQIIATEKPDAICHFTDPRFWGWLYNMEHELRQTMPLMYYNIWDDLPFPHWNEKFYDCCDLLMAISKQTYNINKHVCQRNPRTEGINLTYVPHGIDPNVYYPLSEAEKSQPEYAKFYEDVTKGNEFKFIGLFNSRNIRRKGVADLIQAWGQFALKTGLKEKAALIMHTDIVDDAGTDLDAVKNALAPEATVVFSTAKCDAKHLNWIYNAADVVCNPSSAEGFGLSHMEALMSGTPTIATVVGGLQDQMGFKVDGKELNIKHFTDTIPSNSTGLISKEHGDWVYPLWPNVSLQGSPMTPYIYDSRPTINDIAKGLEFWYNKTSEERAEAGMNGRKWAISNGFTAMDMAEKFSNSVDKCFELWKPREKATMIDAKQELVKIKGVL